MSKEIRYTDQELAEFRVIVEHRIKAAKDELAEMHDPHGYILDISANDLSLLIPRQEKYIQNLQNALIRIDNKTYGICRILGIKISKERLRAVPHATLSIESKL